MSLVTVYGHMIFTSNPQPEILVGLDDGASPVDGVDQPTPCIDRWKNLANEHVKKVTMGPFCQTGIFMSSCRHGVALVLCDMIRSGEL
jgi:hypothetical protein